MFLTHGDERFRDHDWMFDRERSNYCTLVRESEYRFRCISNGFEPSPDDATVIRSTPGR